MPSSKSTTTTTCYLIIDENGKTYACGVGIEGILGIGKLKNVNLY